MTVGGITGMRHLWARNDVGKEMVVKNGKTGTSNEGRWYLHAI
jgi:hypothetical protein